MSVPMRWQQPIEPQPTIRSTPPQRRRNTRRGSRLKVVVGLLLGISACATAAALRMPGWYGVGQQTLRLISTPTKEARVVMTGASVERNLGFVTVTGNVQNRSTRPIGHIEAVIELVGAHDQTVAVESALIGQDTLAAGEAASFRVEMEDHRDAVSYRIHFRKLLGASLD